MLRPSPNHGTLWLHNDDEDDDVDDDDINNFEVYIWGHRKTAQTVSCDHHVTIRKPATRESWIQKRMINNRPHPRHKPTEGEAQRI